MEIIKQKVRELLDTGDNYEVYRWTDEEGGAKSDDRK